MATYEAFDGQDDYSWNDFGDVDRSWDDWFADKWAPGGVFQNTFSKTIYGSWSSTALSSLVFTSDFRPGFIVSQYANLLSSFSVDTTGAGGRTSAVVSTFTNTFTTLTNAIVSFNTSSTIAGVFSPIFSAQANLTAFQLALTSTFDFTASAKVSSFANLETFISAFTFKFISFADPFNSIIPLAETRLLKAITESRLLSAYTESRLLKLLGESRIKFVGAENRTFSIIAELRNHNVNSQTRVIKVPAETRTHILKSKNRVNNIKQETKVITVDSESRIITIKRPSFTDITSNPRVRGD